MLRKAPFKKMGISIPNLTIKKLPKLDEFGILGWKLIMFQFIQFLDKFVGNF
jgi:hypothetical protein